MAFDWLAALKSAKGALPLAADLASGAKTLWNSVRSDDQRKQEKAALDGQLRTHASSLQEVAGRVEALGSQIDALENRLGELRRAQEELQNFVREPLIELATQSQKTGGEIESLRDEARRLGGEIAALGQRHGQIVRIGYLLAGLVFAELVALLWLAR